MRPPENGATLDGIVDETFQESPLGARQITASEGAAFPKRVRTRANTRNPIPLAIPCRRVIGSPHGRGGFGCGLRRKQWMLEHEGIALPFG